MVLKYNYDSLCPSRFGGSSESKKFTEAVVPIALLRKKQKCIGPDGPMCDRVGHEHDRTAIDTSELPSRHFDRLLGRGLMLMKMVDSQITLECYHLKDFTAHHREARRRLVRIAAPLHVCARCVKSKHAMSRGKWDAGSMYTRLSYGWLIRNSRP